MPGISQKAIYEFIEIYEAELGITISFEDASNLAYALLILTDNIYRPIPLSAALAYYQLQIEKLNESDEVKKLCMKKINQMFKPEMRVALGEAEE